MVCFLSEDDEIVVGDGAILDNCLRVLRGISGSATAGDAPSPFDFPTLRPLTLTEVAELQQLCSQ